MPRIKNYNKNILKGICPSHPNEPLIDGKNTCLICKKYNKKRNELCRKNNICISCHIKKVIPGKSMCQACNWKGILRGGSRGVNKLKMSDEQATKILEKQKYICPISGRKLEKGINASPDHIIHRCNNGSNDINNIRFVDTHVNIARSDYSDKELIKLCEDIINFKRGKNGKK